MTKQLFNRKLLASNQQRYLKHFNQHDFLFKEAANLIIENLSFFNRSFGNALEISSRDDYLNQNLTKITNVTTSNLISHWGENSLVIDDEELDFPENSFDLIISNLNLHFINNVPLFLTKIKHFLKKDGVFIASFFGQDNLIELKDVLFRVESALFGGVSPRISPTIDVKTAGSLLQKAGFRDPVSDLERLEVNYQSALDLIKDLKLMGQGNILFDRSRKFITRNFLKEVEDFYQKTYPDLENKGIRAIFEIVTILGIK